MTPKHCRQCGAEINPRRLPRPRYSRLAVILYVVAALVTMVWVGILITWSPVIIKPRGTGGVLVSGAIYLGPGLLIGAFAATRAKVQVVRCGACGWETKIKKRSARAS